MSDIQILGLQIHSILWPLASAVLFPGIFPRLMAAFVALINISLAVVNTQYLLAVIEAFK